MERPGRYRDEDEFYRKIEQFDWKSARLASGFDKQTWTDIDHSIYATKLSVRDKPEMGFYSFVQYQIDKVPHVYIPLINPDGMKDILVEEFYMSSTWFGEIDPEKFERFATEENKINSIMTYLNQTVAGANNDLPLGWFYDAFGVEHGERRGDVYISSHGLGGFSASIELERLTWSDQPIDLGVFADKINSAFTHLKFEQLSKDEYLKAIETKLPFLPKDWKVSI